ncbi:hypothetical protein NDU88_008709 [Pleurodeles waltl]|uniref:ASPIC/UnbV domain-containing protein n=1 Tax=Pleurodeles waltl TaxID=8319 RepID=A0AAV7RT65_PLEWA|nr:hypothetical protein NDU88_008709 [Pleurodeles waltl]
MSDSAVWLRRHGPQAKRACGGADCTAAGLQRPRDRAAGGSGVRHTGDPAELTAGPRELDEVRFEWPPTDEVSTARLRCEPGSVEMP